MLGLSPAQVVGSALAAVSGALLASFAGTTGTIIGTAVGSIVATVGGAIYTWSLKRSSDAVRRTAAQVRQTALLAGPLPRTVAQGPMRSEGDAGEEGVGAEDTPSKAVKNEEERSRRSVPWGKALLASLAVTVVALGGITTFEAVTGQPISSLLGRDDSQGTSVGNLVRTKDEPPPDDRRPTDEASTPAEDESQAPEPDQQPEPDPAQEPTEVPEEPAPSVTPTPDPGVPSGEPSVVPEDGSEGAPDVGSGTDPEAVPQPAPEPAP